MPQPGLIQIGRIARPHGITGEVKVEGGGDALAALGDVKRVYLGSGRTPAAVKGCRFHQNAALLRLAGVADRNAAEALRGQGVFIQTDELPDLPDGEYYAHELVGLRVVDAEGRDVGQLVEVLATGANDVYVIRAAEGEVLLPAIESVVRRIDLGAGVMTVVVPPGL